MLEWDKDYINKIIQGDCLEVMKQMPDKSIDLILTDPPYGVLGKDLEWDNIDIEKFTEKWYKIVLQKIKMDSSLYIFWSEKYLHIGLEIFNPKRVLIWHHPNLAKPTNKMFLYTYDFIFYIKTGRPCFNASFCNSDNVDVLRYAKPQNGWKRDCRFHPTSKPLDLIKKLIRLSSNKNDLILDPFLGSGTTAVAAKELGRRFIGIEISEKYCEIAKKRLEHTEKPLF